MGREQLDQRRVEGGGGLLVGGVIGGGPLHRGEDGVVELVGGYGRCTVVTGGEREVNGTRAVVTGGERDESGGQEMLVVTGGERDENGRERLDE